MGVMRKALFPIVIFLCILTLFTCLYNASVGTISNTQLPSLSSLLSELTNIKIDTFLFDSMGSVIKDIPTWFHIEELEVNPYDSSILVILKNIGAFLYNIFITILQLVQISAILIDFLIYGLKLVLGLFGGVTHLWS